MLIAHRKISPLLLALPVLAAIAAAVALRGGDTSAPRPHPAAPAIPFADATPRTLSTQQLVARYRAEAAATPRSAQAVDNLALSELQMAREDGDPTWYTRADALFGHALTLAPHGRTAAARRALVQATQAGAPSGENTAWAYLYLGNLEFNHGRYAAAESNYRIALHTYPGFVHARAAQAKLAAARGRYQSAIA